MIETIWPIIKYIGIAYVAFVAFLYVFQGFLIFAPHFSSAPALEDTPLAGKAEPITITGEDGIEVTSWIIPPAATDSQPQPSQQPLIIFFHGNAIHALQGSQRALRFAHEGFGFVLAEYRGYGHNDGRPSETSLYSDARRLIASLKEQFPATPFFLYGESIGSGVAVQMATEFDVAGVILEAPFTSVTDIAQKTYPFVPVAPLLKHRFDNIVKIKDIDAPLLILHGAEDSIIPPSYGRRLYDAATEPKTLHIVENAGHNDLLYRGAAETALSFIKQHSKTRDKAPSD